jgi:hypothetical protein
METLAEYSILYPMLKMQLEAFGMIGLGRARRMHKNN